MSSHPIGTEVYWTEPDTENEILGVVEEVFGDGDYELYIGPTGRQEDYTDVPSEEYTKYFVIAHPVEVVAASVGRDGVPAMPE
jgi:hypothetical protein